MYVSSKIIILKYEHNMNIKANISKKNDIVQINSLFNEFKFKISGEKIDV